MQSPIEDILLGYDVFCDKMSKAENDALNKVVECESVLLNILEALPEATAAFEQYKDGIEKLEYTENQTRYKAVFRFAFRLAMDIMERW